MQVQCNEQCAEYFYVPGNSAAATTTKALVEQSRSQVLGMVVNGVTTGNSYGYYYSKANDETAKTKVS